MAPQNDERRKRLASIATRLTEKELEEVDDLFNSGVATDAKRKLRNRQAQSAMNREVSR